MRHSRNDLASTDNLAGLGQSLDHYAVRISKQNGVAHFIASNVSLGLRRIELRSCGLGGSLGAVIGRC